ncbi:MAG: glycoside hydrolase family 28 protein [Clostridia bacterium]|nr:glycoside hydrolase family 28 protein [Clostridia bacterium]
MIDLICVGASAACFELRNSEPFMAPEPFEIWLDGVFQRQAQENVFSLFGLKPRTEHSLKVCMGGTSEEMVFSTNAECCAVDVRAFGAAGDGKTVDTAAIQRAILLLPEGGRLVFPAGTYLTGPIFLKSHMTLELQADACLLGLTDKADYPVLPGCVTDVESSRQVVTGTFEGQTKPMYASLITAEYCEDIAIVGPGCIDGNAANGTWWQTFRTDPVARPRLCFFNHCKQVCVHGIQVRNSASWQLHPYECDQIAFYDVSVSAPKDSPNTDALDPESCDDVRIIGCRFSVGDDCIAIKSGKLDASGRAMRPASRHTIRNCLMAFGHGAVVLGSEISGGVRDLTVSQCLFRETDRGLRIKTRRGRGEGCFIDDVVFENIRMERVLTPVVINMFYRCVDPDGDSDYVQSREKLPVDARTPHLGRFTFRNMTCTDTEVAGCYAEGLPERPLDAVTLENVRIAYSKDAKPGVPAMFTNSPAVCRMGLYFRSVRQVVLRNVVLEGVDGERVITENVDSVTCDGLA